MPTHDYIIANGTGAAVRADINLALSAIVSLNSSASEPATMYAYQLWADTALGLLKIRNSANSAWITLRQLDGDFSIVAVEDGLQATPSLTFTNDLNTGVFRSGADALGIVTGGQYAIACTSTQAVGIKTANPSTALHVAGNARVGADDVTDAHLQIGKGATGNRNSYIDIVADTTYTDYGLRVIRNNTGANATSELKHRGTGALNITTQEAAPIVFNTTNSPSMTILAGGNVGIGTSTPTNTSKLEIQTSSTTAPGLWVQTGGTTSAYPIVDVRNGANLDVFAIKGDGTSYFQGKLGIGVTSPSYKLHVVATSAAAARLVVNDDAAGISALAVTNDTNADFEAVIYTSKASIGSSVNIPICFHTNGKANEKMRLDTSGRLLIGTSTARANFFNSTVSAALQVEGTGNDTSSLSITRNSADVGRAILTLAKTRGGSVGSTTIVQSGDALGSVEFQGSDGTEFVQAAAIQCEVDGTPGANDMPGRIVFSTTPDNQSPVTGPVERMRINSKGALKQSNTGSYLDATNAVNEFNVDNANSYVVMTRCTSATPLSEYIQDFQFSASTPNNTSARFWSCTDATAERAYLASNGGLYNYSANNSNLSDRNAKKDITIAAGTWDCIKEWEIVNYRYKDQPDDADLHLGVIAQQVAESCPEVITIFQEAKDATEDKPAQEERLGIKEQQMYWMAIKALQEAMGRIETLEQRLIAAGID